MSRNLRDMTDSQQFEYDISCSRLIRQQIALITSRLDMIMKYRRHQNNPKHMDNMIAMYIRKIESLATTYQSSCDPRYWDE